MRIYSGYYLKENCLARYFEGQTRKALGYQKLRLFAFINLYFQAAVDDLLADCQDLILYGLG